eukprot:353295-Chlamydomonas_euryale.AAC.7
MDGTGQQGTVEVAVSPCLAIFLLPPANPYFQASTHLFTQHLQPWPLSFLSVPPTPLPHTPAPHMCPTPSRNALCRPGAPRATSPSPCVAGCTAPRVSSAAPPQPRSEQCLTRVPRRGGWASRSTPARGRTSRMRRWERHLGVDNAWVSTPRPGRGRTCWGAADVFGVRMVWGLGARVTDWSVIVWGRGARGTDWGVDGVGPGRQRDRRECGCFKPVGCGK